MSSGSYFPDAEVDELSPQLQKLFGKASEQLGFVPNVFTAYAHRPERFSAWFNHFRQVTEPSETLSGADREMIAVVASGINRCTYCLVSHGQALRHELHDEANADRVTFNWRHADLTDRQRAICVFVEKLTSAPATVERSDVDALAAAGLGPDDIWDVVELTAMYNFTNRISSALGIVPNVEYHSLDRGPAAD